MNGGGDQVEIVFKVWKVRDIHTDQSPKENCADVKRKVLPK